MKMVFTKKMSVSNTRSKKSIRQVQSAEKVGLTQVQSADTAVELVTMPDSDQKRGATMPSFDQKRGATMPSLNQKRGAMKFAFGLKKKDSRRICLIAGLLLLHISCASAMKRKGNGIYKPTAMTQALQLGGIDVNAPPRPKNKAFQCYSPKPDSVIGQSEKKGGNTSGVFGSGGYNSREFRLVDGPSGALLHYFKNGSDTPQKPDEGLCVNSNLYCKKADDLNRGWGRSDKYLLCLWSGGLVNAETEVADYGAFGELDEILKIAQRIGDHQWIQQLRFDSDEQRTQWIANLTRSMQLRHLGGVTVIRNQDDWDEQMSHISDLSLGVYSSLIRRIRHNQTDIQRLFGLFPDLEGRANGRRRRLAATPILELEQEILRR